MGGVVGFTLWPFYPLDRRLGGPQSGSGRRGEGKISDGTRTLLLGRPVPIPATFLSWLMVCSENDYENKASVPHYEGELNKWANLSMSSNKNNC
jgi:hypothetical protein